MRVLHARNDHVGRCVTQSQSSSRRESEIIDSLEGNICRCGAYSRIIHAVQRAASVMAQSEVGKGAGQ